MVGSQRQLGIGGLRIRFPCLLWGPVIADPRLPCNPWGLLNLVITRGTPPRLEGCRPASRGLTLALMTDGKLIAPRRPVATDGPAQHRAGPDSLPPAAP